MRKSKKERSQHSAKCYYLRSVKKFNLNEFTRKKIEITENVVTCPKLIRKSKGKQEVKKMAVPVGDKGKLSQYYEKCDKLYIEQMFYETEKIGEGSFGCVHKARSLEDGKEYAIKVIRRHFSGDKYNEVSKLDKIGNNPYCVQYSNAWEESGKIYIQLELCPMSLENYAKSNHQIGEAECWQILADIVHALIPLHAKGLCHMDIKPENIMVTEDGVYKLADFGLLSDTKEKSFAHSEGDAKYLADEVLKGEVSPAGDIFALGISLMELCMGITLPMYGAHWHELRETSVRIKPPHIENISQDLDLILNWMMEMDHTSRPTLNEIMQMPQIVKLQRSKKDRVNYYHLWRKMYQEFMAENSPAPVAVVLPGENEQGDDERPRTPNAFDEAADPYAGIATPQRRVSAVFLYRRRSVRPVGSWKSEAE